MGSSQLTYNPGILGDEKLARAFVVRRDLLAVILKEVSQSASVARPSRHLLFVGPRGIGKTMLVRRVAAALRSEPEYSSTWYPIVFGEESYPVSTAGEFWLEALFHLADQTSERALQQRFEELREERDEVRLKQQALNELLSFASREKKRLLLVVENLNVLLGEQMDPAAAYGLCETLLNEANVLILATATSRFEKPAEAPSCIAAFTIRQIEPLTIEECGELWSSVTGGPLGPSQLRAIRILTGGNPRLVTILASFAAHHSFRQLMEQLVHLIDDHTEYFKGHLDSLAVKERRVFVALLEHWDPVSAAELARQTRLGVNEVSALLARLGTRGAVEVAHQEGRKKLYQAAERLYNIYYLMRRRGHPEGRVQAAVQFMVTFYEREELVTRTAELAREACQLPEHAREDYYCAYREVLRKMQPIIPQVLEVTPREFFNADKAKLARDVGVAGLTTRAHAFYHEGELAESEKLYRRSLELDDQNAYGWSGLGAVLFKYPNRLAESEAAIRRAIDLDPNGYLWHNLGLIFRNQERWAEAEEAFSKAVELRSDHANSWDQLGHVQAVQERWSDAERAMRSAVQLEPNTARYWNNIAGPLWQLGRLSEAENAFRMAIELEPEMPEPWQGLGHLLVETGPPEEAERVWAEALQRHGEELANCAVHLLDLRLARGVDPGLLINEAQEWIARSKNSPTTLAVMAKFAATSGLSQNLSVAEKWARDAFDRQEDSDTAEALSFVLAEMKKWKEAIDVSQAMLDASQEDEQARQVSTELMIRAAAAGWAGHAVEVLRKSRGIVALEPLAVGLEIYLGEAPLVAKEILEIGHDVANRIHEQAEGAMRN